MMKNKFLNINQKMNKWKAVLSNPKPKVTVPYKNSIKKIIPNTTNLLWKVLKKLTKQVLILQEFKELKNYINQLNPKTKKETD